MRNRLILARTFLAWLMGYALIVTTAHAATASEKTYMVRLSNLVIDSSRLADYKVMLMEEVTTSLRVEPGVLTLYAVFEKEDPTRLTIVEIYADRAAYDAHIRSAHFLKYKSATEHMVKSLKLIDAVPLIPAMTIQRPN